MVINLVADFDYKDALKKIIDANPAIEKSIDNAVKDSSLEININMKMANPVDTGTSRRGWLAPTKLASMLWVVRNVVGYTQAIKYGVKKPSKYISAPKGVTINKGKPFAEVTEESFAKVIESLNRRINLIVGDLWKTA